MRPAPSPSTTTTDANATPEIFGERFEPADAAGLSRRFDLGQSSSSHKNAAEFLTNARLRDVANVQQLAMK
jgi:hypothetical protein